jgi:hypothetical protein
MKVLQAAEGEGKTQYMLELSEETKIPLVCFSEDQKKRLQEQARNAAMSIPEPLTMLMLQTGRAQGKTVLVDDLDVLLSFAFPGVTIDTATITNDRPY